MMRYLPIFVILALIAEILGTVGGFGSSVFFVPMANYFIDFKTVLGITALFHLSSNLSKIFLFKKGVNKKLVLSLGIPAVIFVSVGAYLSRFVNPLILTYFLGAFLITISLILILNKNLYVNPSKKNAIIGGVLSGLSAGLLGTGGAIRGITMATFKLKKEQFIATSAIIDLGIDLSRSIIYTANGYVKQEDVYLVLILVVVGFVGTYIGKKLLNKISQERFRQSVLYLILAIGVTTLVINFIKI